MHKPKTFSNEKIKIIGVINNSVECNDWVATNVNVTVLEDGHRPIIGRDLLSQLGLSHTQTNIDNLIDTIQQNLDTNASHETAYFSTLDLKYAYSYLNLDPQHGSAVQL